MPPRKRERLEEDHVFESFEHGSSKDAFGTTGLSECESDSEEEDFLAGQPGKDDEAENESEISGEPSQNAGPVPHEPTSSPFGKRNSQEALISIKERFEKEKKPLAEEEEAMLFISKVTTLNNIPNGVTDLLLTPENLKKLTLLSSQKMVTIERKVAQISTTYGHDVILKSGNKIRYLPVVHSLLRELQGNAVASRELILYWDGFRKFRAKGGTLGEQLHYSSLPSSLDPSSLLISFSAFSVAFRFDILFFLLLLQVLSISPCCQWKAMLPSKRRTSASSPSFPRQTSTWTTSQRS